MYDHTVVVDLVRSSDNVVAKTHYFGTGGDPKDVVKIGSDGLGSLFYQTNFRRSDIGALSPTAYVVKVYFLDVDNNLVLQGTSKGVSF